MFHNKRADRRHSMSKHLQKLLEIMHFLRTSPDGCAWTKEQTHQSLIPSLIEESYETVETIDNGKVDDDLRDELGDILLQVAFHAQLAQERKAFTFDDVAKAIVDKLERRYPTILGNEPNTLKTPQEIDRRWQEVKAEERRKKGIDPAKLSLLDGISSALPALIRTQKFKERVTKVGWQWPNVDALLGKVDEELDELKAEVQAENPDKKKITAELGDVLLTLVDCAHWHGIDAEEALRTTVSRVEARFRHMEQALKDKGLAVMEATPEERRALWNEAKALERQKKAS